MSESTPTLTDVLLAHAWNDYVGHCSCGWYVPSNLFGDEIDLAHAAHQAQAVEPILAAVRADERERISSGIRSSIEAHHEYGHRQAIAALGGLLDALAQPADTEDGGKS